MTSLLGFLLGGGAGSESKGKEKEKAAEMPTKHECAACLDAITGVAIQAPCGDYYDLECLLALVRASLKDESLFPPRCCRQPIPLPALQPHLSPAQVQHFRERTVECATPRRIYCHVPTCSKFLGPAFDPAKWFFPGFYTCSACSSSSSSSSSSSPSSPTIPSSPSSSLPPPPLSPLSPSSSSSPSSPPSRANRTHSTCTKCRGAYTSVLHGLRCPGAPNTAAPEVQVLALGARERWAACPACAMLVELDAGCFHVTCRCRTEFCYLCERVWKTCACAQWDEELLVRAAERRVDGGGGGGGGGGGAGGEQGAGPRQRQLQHGARVAQARLAATTQPFPPPAQQQRASTQSYTHHPQAPTPQLNSIAPAGLSANQIRRQHKKRNKDNHREGQQQQQQQQDAPTVAGAGGRVGRSGSSATAQATPDRPRPNNHHHHHHHPGHPLSSSLNFSGHPNTNYHRPQQHQHQHQHQQHHHQHQHQHHPQYKAERERRIREAIEDLRRNGAGCQHPKWRGVAGRMRPCELCGGVQTNFIMACVECQFKACNHCRKNRL